MQSHMILFRAAMVAKGPGSLSCTTQLAGDILREPSPAEICRQKMAVEAAARRLPTR